MSRFQTEPPADLAGAQWAKQASAGETRIPLDMSPRAFAVKRFPVRVNHYESAVLQMAADLNHLSKQQMARRAIREFCERQVRGAGLNLPKGKL